MVMGYLTLSCSMLNKYDSDYQINKISKSKHRYLKNGKTGMLYMIKKLCKIELPRIAKALEL